jgi:outer membrane protein TolC
MQHNRALIQAREQINQIKGDQVSVRSRFMPHLDLTANYNADRTELRGTYEDFLSSRLRYSQRLFEFGPNAAQEINLRDNLRQALYAYQGQVYTVLARIWELFHLILLQDQQIAIRQQSRDNFEEILKRQEARFKFRLADEEAVLSARLNVLNEELEINNLERGQFNDKMELLRLIGQPIGTQLQLAGNLQPFTLDQDHAVQIALDKSVEIALRSEGVKEQQRVVGEIKWDYAPDLSVDAGLQDVNHNARISVNRDGPTWGVNLNSEFALREDSRQLSFSDDGHWFAQVEARIPIFEGSARLGRERRERARLSQLKFGLEDRTAEVELQVRQAYQSMLQAEGQQEIQARRVEIARRRLNITQILSEKGQVNEVRIDQVRDQFFNDQNRLFDNQATFIRRQANLRRLMGFIQ